LSRHALGMEKFREIIATEEVKISWPGHEWDRIIRNQNRLLDLYPGGDGVKTGWTTPAGRCFVGSATRDGWQLISVVLNAPSMWEDAMYLLDYGYEHYSHHPLVRQHAYIQQVPLQGGVQDNLRVMASESYAIALKPQEVKHLSYTFNIAKGLQAPVKKGHVVGSLDISLEGERLGSVMLLAGEDVEKAGFFFRVSRFIHRLFTRS
jgi:serine-type D-Ala-D-Ala carboxypeptidase (penicillin-binding protein 5/6)